MSQTEMEEAAIKTGNDIRELVKSATGLDTTLFYDKQRAIFGVCPYVVGA